MSDLIHRAKSFARAMHRDQLRQYTAEPYIVHCGRVASIVTPYVDETSIAAAWLHDVKEDCDVTWRALHALFGAVVVQKVWYLTDVPREIGNRAERKKIDRDRLATAPASVQTIKCGDLIDNTSDIVKHDPKFAKLYLAEKRALLDVLTLAHPLVRALAEDMLLAGEEHLQELAEMETAA